MLEPLTLRGTRLKWKISAKPKFFILVFKNLIKRPDSRFLAKSLDSCSSELRAPIDLIVVPTQPQEQSGFYFVILIFWAAIPRQEFLGPRRPRRRNRFAPQGRFSKIAIPQGLCPYGKWSPFSAVFWEPFGILLAKFPRSLFNFGGWSRFKIKNVKICRFRDLQRSLPLRKMVSFFGRILGFYL